MSKEFTYRKLNWLEDIVADRRLHKWVPFAIAVKLACRYLNHKTETAFPSVGRLARELNTNRRNVQRAFDQLVESGWLGREIGGGRAHTNRYRLKGGLHAAVSAHVKGGRDDRKGGRDDAERAVHAPPEPFNEPFNNTARGTAASRRDRGVRTGKSGRYKSSPSTQRPAAIIFPAKWEFGPVEAKIALDIASWDGVRARQEFLKFRKWHQDRSTRSSDWLNERWVNWSQKGRDIADQDVARQQGLKPQVAQIIETSKRIMADQRARAAAQTRRRNE
jgi:hypothetical protein